MLWRFLTVESGAPRWLQSRRLGLPTTSPQDPLRPGHPNPAARLLRAAGAEELPARQRLPDLPDVRHHPRVPAPAPRAAHRGPPVLQLITAAQARGQARLVEMNQQVLGNLDQIIGALGAEPDPASPEAADAG